MEERIAGEHVGVVEDPAEHLTLLVVGQPQVLVAVDAPTRGPEPGDAQLRPVVVGHGLVLVELVDVVAGAHDGDLELAEVGRSQVVHGAAGRRPRPLAPDGVVGGRIHAVEADLHVEVRHGRQAAGGVGVEVGAVGGELHADVAVDGVLDDVEEITPQHGLAAAHVHVEHLQIGELVDDRERLGGGELVGVAPAGARQAVHARQVAGVGELPGETDGGVEAGLELVDERWGPGGGAHGAVSSAGSTTPDSHSEARAVT